MSSDGLFADLRRRLDCLDVARHLGSNTKGRYFTCPDESCPSLKRRARRAAKAFPNGTWNCMACEQRGDSVDLFALRKGLTMKEARAEAMSFAGLSFDQPPPPLPPPPPPPPQLNDYDYEKHVRVLTIATDHYHRLRTEGDDYLDTLGPTMHGEDRESTNRGLMLAYEYLNRRGLPPLADYPVPIGLVPAWRTGLKERLHAALGNAGTKLGQAAGVLKVTKKRTWETFRGRVWLPWRNEDGQTVNAKGRAIPDLAQLCGLRLDQRGKPDLPMYFLRTTGDDEHKPHTRRPEHPFGWLASVEMLAAGLMGPILVVEGEIDAISAHLVQRPAVATGGTAGVGRSSLKTLLHKLGVRSVVLFDGDEDERVRSRTEAAARSLAEETRSEWVLLPHGDLNDRLQNGGGRRGLLDAIDKALLDAVPPPEIDDAQADEQDGPPAGHPAAADAPSLPGEPDGVAARTPEGAAGASPLGRPPDLPANEERDHDTGRPVDLDTERQPHGWGIVSTGQLLRLASVNHNTGQERWERTGVYWPPRVAWRGRDVYEKRIVLGLRGRAIGVDEEVETVIPRQVARTTREIVAALAPVGYDVQTATAGALVRYLADYERTFAEAMELRVGSSQMGWYGKAFLYGDQTIGGTGLRYIGEDQQRVSSLGRSGERDEWIEGVLRPLERHPIAMVGLYAAMAAPVLHHVPDLTGFCVEFAGLSSRGKTTVSSAIASAFGDPRSDCGLLRTPADTYVALEQYASFNGCLPLFLEDTHLIEPKEKARNIVMMWVNGAGKGRGRKSGDGMRPVKRWKSVSLLTSEASICGSTTFGGVGSRVLSFPPPLPEASEDEEVIEEIRTIERSRVRHYGHAGRDWVRFLVNGGVSEVLEAFDQWLPVMQRKAPSIGTVQRWAKAFALILATSQVAHEVIGGSDVTSDILEVAIDHVRSAAPPDQAAVALDTLLSWVATDAAGGVVGDSSEPEAHQRSVWFRIMDDGCVCVDAVEARRRLATIDVYLPDILREWVRREWVMYKGKVQSRVRVRMARGPTYAIPLAPEKCVGFRDQPVEEETMWQPSFH